MIALDGIDVLERFDFAVRGNKDTLPVSDRDVVRTPAAAGQEALR